MPARHDTRHAPHSPHSPPLLGSARRAAIPVTLPAPGAAASADDETALAAAEAARVSAALWQPQVPVGVTEAGVAYPAHTPASRASAPAGASGAASGSGATWAATPSSAHGMAVAAAETASGSGAGGAGGRHVSDEDADIPGDVAEGMRSVEYARAVASAAAGCQRGA